jgi:hypothetical protein
VNVHIGNGICMCGRKIETTGGGIAAHTIYENGECVYAICSHGIVVVDERRRP